MPLGNDYLPYLLENQVPIGVWIPCAKARQVDEAKFFSNMILDGGPHLIDTAAEARVFNFWESDFMRLSVVFGKIDIPDR